MILVVADAGADDANVLKGKEHQDTCTSRTGKATHTFTLSMIQIVVTNHLYPLDQFCGFAGSSGPSQSTIFGSFGAFAKRAGPFVTGLFGGGSSTSSPPYLEIAVSSRVIVASKSRSVTRGLGFGRWGDGGLLASLVKVIEDLGVPAAVGPSSLSDVEGTANGW